MRDAGPASKAVRPVCYNPAAMLYRFHAALISCGILFAFGFALYQVVKHGTGSGAHRATAIGFAAGGVGLSLYLRWFLRSRKR